MGLEFVTVEEIQAIIDKGVPDEASLKVYEHVLGMIRDGYAVFYDNEAKEWFAAEHGKPIPLHMHAVFLKK